MYCARNSCPGVARVGAIFRTSRLLTTSTEAIWAILKSNLEERSEETHLAEKRIEKASKRENVPRSTLI
jgi:hypothetical protein